MFFAFVPLQIDLGGFRSVVNEVIRIQHRW